MKPIHPAVVGALIFGCLLLTPCLAHIIPPEDLHPAAQSYRDASFILNRNPVVWTQIWNRMEVIAEHLEKVSPDRAEAFRVEIAAARAIVEPAGDPGEEFDSVVAREAQRRSVFVAATRAVAALVVAHLDEIDVETDRDRVALHLQQGRRVFEAFTATLEVADPVAFDRLGRAWLAALTHLGNEGVLGAGARPIDLPSIRNEVVPIRAYVNENYLEYEVGEGEALDARPMASPTHDSEARLPIRLPPGSQINKLVPRPRQILGMAARGVDESETPLIALGDMAFDSAYILGERAQALQISCNTCHNKGTINPNFFIPGLSSGPGNIDVSNSYFAGHANNGVFDPVDIPDLRGIRFTAPYGRDGRFASLREFTRNVIVHEFDGPEPDPILLDSIVAYMNQFEFLPNPALDRAGSLDAARASAAARRGDRIFRRSFPGLMGGKSCASCHIPSDHFLDRRRHDLGTVAGSEPHSRDGARDTPTLLGVRHTGPYMHDGRFPTLRAVVDWFDEEFELRLTDAQAGDLTAYLETIGDGVDPYEASPYYLDAEMEEFSFFLSTYDYLRRIGRHDLVGVTFRTVASEIDNHKWELRDPSFRPVLEELSGLMTEADRLNAQERYDEVDVLVARYRALYQENVDHLK